MKKLINKNTLYAIFALRDKMELTMNTGELKKTQGFNLCQWLAFVWLTNPQYKFVSLTYDG